MKTQCLVPGICGYCKELNIGGVRAGWETTAAAKAPLSPPVLSPADLCHTSCPTVSGVPGPREALLAQMVTGRSLPAKLPLPSTTAWLLPGNYLCSNKLACVGWLSSTPECHLCLLLQAPQHSPFHTESFTARGSAHVSVHACQVACPCLPGGLCTPFLPRPY